MVYGKIGNFFLRWGAPTLEHAAQSLGFLISWKFIAYLSCTFLPPVCSLVSLLLFTCVSARDLHVLKLFCLGLRGRVDDLSFFEYLSPFCFLSIEFHCTFSISYKILPHFVYYYCTLIRM